MTSIVESSPAGSLDARFDEVYSQLRRLARGQRASGQDTLNTTALVHELYLQMRNGSAAPQVNEPRQFYAYAARAMRHLLVDRARARLRLKRGGDLQRVDLTDSSLGPGRASPEQAILLDDALRRLSDDDARAAEVMELHYFSGLPIERIAELLGVSSRTVDRHWRYARAFLHAQFAE
ncbi:MAG: sigma-70 family RNA polymerase sigma factor [Rhodanobacteraceae bacterium]|nr:sigma-70 family RNA polymerase sigma factor [Rhodanobacteraceae bacterium]